MIRYKSPELELEFRKAHSMTRMIVIALSEDMEKKFGKDITITSVYRDDGGVHSFFRGVDVRINGKYKDGAAIAGEYPDAPTIAEARAETASLNRRYIYDASRPEKSVAFFGEMDRSNAHWNHIHIQAHDSTRLAVSQQPDVLDGDDLIVNEQPVSKTIFHNPPASKSDIAWMTARRIGKAATGIGIGILANRFLGATPAESLVIMGGYLGAEKATNAAVENKTGKPINFDIVSAVIFILQWIKETLAKRKGGE